MTTLTGKRLELRARYQAARSRLAPPDPVNVFVFAAFAWALLCFFLVTGGQRFAYQIARLGSSETVFNILLINQTDIAWVMIAGLVGLAAAFFILGRYRWLSIGAFLIAMNFSGSLWRPLHDLAFGVKYLAIVYLACSSFLFFYRNGWRLIDTKGYRLLCAYLAWVGFITAYNGLAIGDLWFLSTEFCLMLGFGVVWLGEINDAAQLRKLNFTVAFAAVVVTFCHLLAPLVYPEFTQQGRFVSTMERATGFAVPYSPFVVALFWASMYDKSAYLQRVFTVLAFIGFGLILWSGTRNATFATLIGVFGVWWVFRTKLLVYIVAAGIVALLVQIFVGNTQDLVQLGDRLSSTTNNRSEVWELYLELAMERPLLGYGFEGLRGAIYGESLVEAIGNIVRLSIPSAHNHYLGVLVRFGVVGLLLNLLIIGAPLLRAWRVIFSPLVHASDKKLYVLPAALLLVVALEGLFEDSVGSGGKGSLHGLIFALGVPVVYLYGGHLLDAAAARSTLANAGPEPSRSSA